MQMLTWQNLFCYEHCLYMFAYKKNVLFHRSKHYTLVVLTTGTDESCFMDA